MTDNAPDESSELTLPESGDPDFDSLNRFYRIVGKHDDRGMVLTLGAFAEDTLGRLLLTYLVDGKPAEDLVEGFNAPLGTFASRNKAAYSMGLLVHEQYEDLEILRKIRNAFAHSWEGISLEKVELKALIGKLHGYTFDDKPIEVTPGETILDAAARLGMQIAQNRKRGVKAPVVGFRLTTKKPT